MNKKLQNIGLVFGALAVGVFMYKATQSKSANVGAASYAISTDGKMYMQTAQNDGGINGDVVGGGLTWV